MQRFKPAFVFLVDSYITKKSVTSIKIIREHCKEFGGNLKDTEVIVVFDAYKIRGHVTEKMDYLGVHVVYTKEAETADQYISRFTIENSKNLDITVATSDALVQLIILGQNAKLMSARELYEDVKRAKEGI